MPVSAQEPPLIIPTTPVQASKLEPVVKETAPQASSSKATFTPPPPSLPPLILTPPPTMKMSPSRPQKGKRTHIQLVNYLDDKAKRPSRRSRCLHSYQTLPYKYSQTQEDNY